MSGLFVSLEGADGTGKTTAAQNAAAMLENMGIPVVLTREPGGSAIAESIRSVLLDPENTDLSPEAEALLYAAARNQHLHDIVLPALREGKVVLCDRFVDSSLVYQGMARDLGVDRIMELNRFAANGLMPDVTFLLEAPADILKARRNLRQENDRFEQESGAFHETVRQGFAQLKDMFPERIVAVDAAGTPEEIAQEIAQRIRILYE